MPEEIAKKDLKTINSAMSDKTVDSLMFYNSWVDFEGNFRNEAIAKNVLK